MDENRAEEAVEVEAVTEEALPVSYPKLYELRLYLISSILLAGSLALPFVLHLFGIAGQIFLPIYLFALLAGLVYGSRCGLLVGALAPIISFSITQMPPAVLLPFVILKAVSLGLISGIFVEQTKGKMLYLASACAVLFALINGNLLLYMISSGNTKMALTDLMTGLPGIMLLLVVIPYISSKILRYERKIIRRYSRQLKEN